MNCCRHLRLIRLILIGFVADIMIRGHLTFSERQADEKNCPPCTDRKRSHQNAFEETEDWSLEDESTDEDGFEPCDGDSTVLKTAECSHQIAFMETDGDELTDEDGYESCDGDSNKVPKIQDLHADANCVISRQEAIQRLDEIEKRVNKVGLDKPWVRQVVAKSRGNKEW
jgi:hypothetical protein